MKQNEIRDVVNQVRDIAKQFFNTEQLRERIANVLVPILSKSIDEHTKEECEKDHGPYNEDAPLHERLRWWVPKSARHGATTLESDLLEAVEVTKGVSKYAADMNDYQIEDFILPLLRKNLRGKAYDQMTYQSWKDSIDIERPTGEAVRLTRDILNHLYFLRGEPDMRHPKIQALALDAQKWRDHVANKGADNV